ncbi:hypothetical protein BJV74DRAFT_222224 [Russula compacta]|nr:hypothetical protein BJV74DRAFT_222224 [Russula compacta]
MTSLALFFSFFFHHPSRPNAKAMPSSPRRPQSNRLGLSSPSPATVSSYVCPLHSLFSAPRLLQLQNTRHPRLLTKLTPFFGKSLEPVHPTANHSLPLPPACHPTCFLAPPNPPLPWKWPRPRPSYPTLPSFSLNPLSLRRSTSPKDVYFQSQSLQSPHRSCARPVHLTHESSSSTFSFGSHTLSRSDGNLNHDQLHTTQSYRAPVVPSGYLLRPSGPRPSRSSLCCFFCHVQPSIYLYAQIRSMCLALLGQGISRTGCAPDGRKLTSRFTNAHTSRYCT